MFNSYRLFMRRLHGGCADKGAGFFALWLGLPCVLGG